MASRAIDIEMDRAAMTWLRLAKDRSGGHELRAARKRDVKNSNRAAGTVSTVAVDVI